MAGDWIKMRVDLQTHPKVVRIASALHADRLRVVGGLHAVWCLFDMHSIDGRLDGYTIEALDDLIGFDGFGLAMASVGWLEIGSDYLETPRFQEHNGQSAKRRAQEAERKRDVRKVSASDADKKRTREEKRREEVILTPDGVSGEKPLALSPDAPPATPSASKPEAPDACPHEAIIAAYHECLPMGRRIRDWTPARAAALRSRWREDAKRQNLDWWRRFFGYCAQSRFLTGQASASGGRRPFEVSLDWLVKAENFAKVREGAFHEPEEVAA